MEQPHCVPIHVVQAGGFGHAVICHHALYECEMFGQQAGGFLPLQRDGEVICSRGLSNNLSPWKISIVVVFPDTDFLREADFPLQMLVPSLFDPPVPYEYRLSHFRP